MTFEHHVGNKLLTVTMNALFQVKVRDSQSGMWVMRKDQIGKMNLKDDGMAMSEEIKIEAFKKLRSRESPYIIASASVMLSYPLGRTATRTSGSFFKKCFEYE